ncbi:MAG: hypothetical protein OEV08_10080 [Nitrospira sp.]|nr:hypothetical protein [Nitrospira sp.]
MRKMTIQRVLLFMISVVLAPVGSTEGLAQTGTAQQDPAVVKKYPPYPDVWRSITIGRLCKADNGDFYTVSEPFRKKGVEGTSYIKIAAFFGHSVTELDRTEADKIWLEGQPFPGAGVLKCQGNKYSLYSSSLTLPNGFAVESTCLVKNLCAYSFVSGLEVHDADQHVVSKAILISLLKTPHREFLPYPQVASDKAGEIMKRVHVIVPVLVALEDETFLIHPGGGGALFRLDKSLKIRFLNSEHQFFFVDPSLMERAYRQAEQIAEPDSLAWHQAFQDAAAELLNNLQKETKP